jgi:hypothetical protein
MVSGYIWPSRLGTSSPKMMVRKVMIDHHQRGGADLGRFGGTCMSTMQPGRQRRRERRVADDAVEDADRL